MSLSVSRETVLSALFALVSSAQFTSPVCGRTTWGLASRRVRLFADVSRTDRPALFMVCHEETPTYRAENVPAYLSMGVNLLVYLDATNPVSVPDTDISVVLDAIDAALSPGPGEQRLTLGGLVSHCRVDGQIVRDPGDIDGDGLIVYPLRITLT